MRCSVQVLCDACSQTVKLGVQYSLWGGSVINLGTERHRKKYFDDIDRFRLPGGLLCICCLCVWCAAGFE